MLDLKEQKSLPTFIIHSYGNQFFGVSHIVYISSFMRLLIITLVLDARSKHYIGFYL